MNVQERFKIIVDQMLFSPELHTYESEELKHREKGQCHDFLHEIITHYKSNQVNTWFMRKMRSKRNGTCCWFDQKPSNAQLNNLEKNPPLKWRSEQTITFVILVDKDGLPHDKEAAITNHQLQRLTSSIMNFL